MEITAGRVVKSTAGHDKEIFHIVLSVEHDYAYIADGRRRLIEKPKRKKLRHLSQTKTVYELTDMTNKKLRGLLMPFNRTDRGGNELV